MSEPITVLLPCKQQTPQFLDEAIASVRRQSSPHWELLVGFDETTPAVTRLVAESIGDERVRSIVVGRCGFGAALNAMMRDARTTFVAVLLSDDRLDPDAVATVQRYRAHYPRADFFHSARCEIDAEGRRIGAIMPSAPSVSVGDFKRSGSPVKHLMCWRRELALAHGGMDETLSEHGCDDYDFPWRMAEAGARFQRIEECLYEYRVHDRSPRLTTTTPLQQQVATLERMFARHGASDHETCAYLERAADSYLGVEFCGGSPDGDRAVPLVRHRRTSADVLARLRAAGIAQRRVFPHRLYVLPRGGADGMHLAQVMCGITEPEALRQMLLFADASIVDQFPRELFFDDDVVWHGDQLGMPGLVAAANIALAGETAYVTQMLSDVVQRISRRRELKTRVERCFEGWAHMLANGVAGFARDAGVRTIRFATSGLVMANTDPSRTVRPELFERIYDRAIAALFDLRRAGPWWEVELDANAGRIVPLERTLEALPAGRTVCIVHDIEGGEGHRVVEPEFAERAALSSPAALEAMLAIEAAAGVRTTYNVLGMWLEKLRGRIEGEGHAVAFHSYSHAVADPPSWIQRWRARLRLGPSQAWRTGEDFAELVRCRTVDYRLPGYRPPMSRLTPGLADRHLAYFNFQWLASSSYSFGFDQPCMQNGIVKIPVHVDDFDLHRGRLGYAEWERELLARVDTGSFVAVGLHDCYGEHWLAHYPQLLARLGQRSRLATCTEVANETALASTRWL